MLDEAGQVTIGIIIFIAVCLLASWLGEKMHTPEKYYKNNSSYVEDACSTCDYE